MYLSKFLCYQIMNSINGDLLNFVDDLNKRIYQNMVSTLCALQGNFQHLEDLLQLQKTVQNIKESAFYKMNKEVPLKAEKSFFNQKLVLCHLQLRRNV